ncbi:hypothetical protein DOTSEDRAFT_20451 [Dothistroma septosporum NZE10]|uniref:Uncharacterized protein n=1 Tax=Dothistroma septosporum (strain NZE10 / CBS 128990) TaxID=675120 RepID=N1Q475_DOTSN|nr:hypothetical protein DOTSEDRAFT_20451 [Dothistroma septosporum NZE10]
MSGMSSMSKPGKLARRLFHSKYSILNNVKEENEDITAETKKAAVLTPTTPVNKGPHFTQVINDHYAKALRKGPERSRLTARTSQLQNDQGKVAKLGNRNGVKYELGRPNSTLDHNVPYDMQLPGKIFPAAIATHCPITSTVYEVNMYSFGDTGLYEGPEKERGEYINIMPHGMEEKDDYTPHNPNVPILKIAAKFGRRDMRRTTMAVRVNKISTRITDRDELELCGELDKKSLDILIAEIAKAQGFEVPQWKDEGEETVK